MIGRKIIDGFETWQGLENPLDILKGNFQNDRSLSEIIDTFSIYIRNNDKNSQQQVQNIRKIAGVILQQYSYVNEEITNAALEIVQQVLEGALQP